jgi:hypothetical protein
MPPLAHTPTVPTPMTLSSFPYTPSSNMFPLDILHMKLPPMFRQVIVSREPGPSLPDAFLVWTVEESRVVSGAVMTS